MWREGVGGDLCMTGSWRGAIWAESWRRQQVVGCGGIFRQRRWQLPSPQRTSPRGEAAGGGPWPVGVRVGRASPRGGWGHNCNHLWKVSSRTVTTFGFSFLKIPSVAGGQSLQGTKTRIQTNCKEIWKERLGFHIPWRWRGDQTLPHKIMFKINATKR